MERRFKFLVGFLGVLAGTVCTTVFGQIPFGFSGTTTSGYANATSGYTNTSTTTPNGWVPVGTSGRVVAQPVSSQNTQDRTVQRMANVGNSTNAAQTGQPVATQAPLPPTISGTRTANTVVNANVIASRNASAVQPVSGTTSAASNQGGVNSAGYVIPMTSSGTVQTGNMVRATSATMPSNMQNRVNFQFGIPQLASRSPYGAEQIPTPQPMDAQSYYAGNSGNVGYAAGYTQETPAYATGYSAPYAQASYGDNPYVAPTSYNVSQPAYMNYANTGTGYSNGSVCAPGVCGEVGCDTGCATGCDTGCANGYIPSAYNMYANGYGANCYDPGLSMLNPLQGLPCVTSFSVGSEAFRSPVDGNRQGNIGIREAFNLSGPMGGAMGFGYQMGIAGFQGNFGGNNDPNFDLDDGDRSQLFLTGGIFRRNPFRGFQGGIVYDYMRDSYYFTDNMQAVRGELSFRFHPRFDAGYYGVFNTGKSVTLVDGSNEGEYELATLHTAFLRWTFDNGANARINGGASRFGDGFVGSSLTAPLSERLAISTQCYGLFPDEKTSSANVRNNAWGLGMQLTWYPGRGSSEALQNPYNALFDVAGNMTNFYTRVHD